MPENPFKPHTKIEESNPKANEKLVADLLGTEDGAAYAALDPNAVEFLVVDKEEHTLTEEEGKEIVEARRTTPEQIIALLKEAGSPAVLDESFEGGIVSIDIPPDITDWPSSKVAFKAADNGSPSELWDGLSKGDWTQPDTKLDIIVLTYHADPDIQKSSDKVSEDMKKACLRPLTMEEMLCAGVAYTAFTKTHDIVFISLRKYGLFGDGSFGVPSLFLRDSKRMFIGDHWDYPWFGRHRFLAVRQ